MATPTSGSGNLVDEFEEAFQSCLNVLTKDETSPNPDKDETKVEVEQTTLRFIDLARQMEAFFLQKRFLLSALKPELVINNDISDLRLELGRKEELLKRHYEKISHWQNMLADVQGWAKSPAQGPAAAGMSNGSSVVSSTNGMAPQQTPGGPQTPNSLGVTNMSNTLQQVQQMHQVQQQQMQQAQLQQQMQAQIQQQQQQQQMHAQLQQQMQVSSQQAMFMQQGAGRGGFGPQGPPSAAVLQGPLAYLEKTTSNIGMTDGRR